MNAASPSGDHAAAWTFLKQASIALCDTGVPISHVTDRMQAVASVFGLHGVTIFALPTGVLLGRSDGTADVARALGTTPGGSAFRLDQLTELQHLLDDVTRGRCTPARALDRLTAINATPPRYGLPIVIAGHALFGLGFGLLLQPTLLALPLYAVLSAAVGGAAQFIGARRPAAAVLYPALAAFFVTVVVNLVAPVTGEDPSHALIAPLVSLLPTAAMTYAVIDLSNGDSIAGAARIATSAQRFVLLGLGAYVATELIAVANAPASHPALTWGPWLGVAVFCVGVVLTQSGDPRALPYLLVIAYITFAVQYATTQASAAALGGIAAGAASVIAASALRRFPHAPPSYTGFMPVLWLIVPGAIGLQGVVDLHLDGPAAVGEIGRAALTIVALSAGILAGLLLCRRPTLARR